MVPPKLIAADEVLPHLLHDRPWYLRARLVLLLLAWCVALFGGLTLHVLCDVFQGLPMFPLIPSLFSAVLFNGVGACITAYVGTLTVSGFRLYQPFVGGQSFVVMQTFGYGTVCLAEALVCVYIQASRTAHGVSVSATSSSPLVGTALDAEGATTFADVTASAALHPLQHFGVLSILGTFPFIANATLMSSLMFFVQPPTTPGSPPQRRVRFERSTASIERFLHHWSKSPRREMALVIAFSTVVIAFAIVGALIPAASRISLVLYLALQTINALLIHVFIGWRSTPGYHLFMPRLNSLRCTVTQFVLWTLFVVLMYWCVGELSMSSSLDAGVPPTSPTRLLALAIGGVSVTTALMLFVRTAFDDATTSKRGSPGGNDYHHLGSRTMLSRYGPATLTCASFLHACLIWACDASRSSSLPGNDRATNTLHLDGYHVAQSVAALFMMSFPPATHLMGKLVIGEPFSIWQPFRGCLPFIAMQGVGWTAFGGSFVACAAHLSNHSSTHDNQSILLLAALCVFSQAMIHGSLIVFAPGDDSEAEALASMIPTLPKAASRVTSMLRKKRPVSLVSAVLNGEMLVALLMIVTVLTLRVVCDVGVLQLKAVSSVTSPTPIEQPLTPATLHFIAFVTTWMGVATVPIAHISGRDKGIDVFRPFGGSGAYVALQAIGWTLYSASLLVTILAIVVQSAATLDANTTSWMTWTGGFGAVVNRSTKQMASPLSDLPPCWFCVDAMMWALPLALIVVSVAVETEKNWAKHSDEEEVWDTESRLLALVAEAMPQKKDQAMAAQLIKRLTASQRRYKTPWSAYSVMESKTASVKGEAQHVRRARIKEQQGTATLIICMTCVGTAVLFIVGAVWIGREPRVLSKGFAFAAFVLTTITCFATHYVYGTLVHGDQAYAFFMPFSGGISFVALQAVGWAFYTAATVLVLHTFLLSEAEVHTYLIAAIFSVSAQALILGSIPRYEGRTRGQERTTLERNAEALVAGLLFIASFSYAQAHRSWGSQHSNTASEGGAAAGANEYAASSAMVPLVVSCVTSCFAVPLTVAAIHRSLRGQAPFTLDDHEEVDDEPGTRGATNEAKGHVSHHHQHAQVAFLVHRVVQLVGMTTALLLVLLPVALAFVLHFVVHLSVGSFGAETATTAWLYVTVSIGLTTLCGVFLDVLGSRGTITSSSNALRCLRVATNTFAVFSIPTYVVVGPLSLPFVLPQSKGAQLFTGHALLLVLVGDFPMARFALSIAEVCMLAFTLTLHLSEDGGTHGVRWGMEVVADIVLPLLMLWYHRTFVGAPETRGQLVSPAMVKRLKAICCFDDVADYFQMRVLVDRSKAVGDAAPCWESSPVIFSYHPHGVFPATTLLLPHTRVWRDAIRLPSMSDIDFPRLSVHGAGVIFRVPFMRDFVMALGARVVTRRAIEASLNQNNSVMIVTGGQAEMLHTKYSDTEMHLVTHHLGFLKLAVRHQVPVVPIVCFAEHNVMDNIHLPWLQKKMLRLIGFPFPTVPHGRWFLPLPNRTPLSVVVGPPVNPPHGLVVDDIEGVQAFAAAYIGEVRRLFYKYRAECGYPNMELVLHEKSDHSHHRKQHAKKT